MPKTRICVVADRDSKNSGQNNTHVGNSGFEYKNGSQIDSVLLNAYRKTLDYFKDAVERVESKISVLERKRHSNRTLCTCTNSRYACSGTVCLGFKGARVQLQYLHPWFPYGRRALVHSCQ